MTEPRFGCPHCGSDELQEANVAYTWLTITGWDDAGNITDIDGSDAQFPEWETEDTPNPFRCANCRETFSEPRRLDGAA